MSKLPPITHIQFCDENDNVIYVQALGRPLFESQQLGIKMKYTLELEEV